MKKWLVLQLLILLLITGAATVSDRCEHPSVGPEEVILFSEDMHREIRFNVYMPPCYREERFPVLVLLHGQDMGMDIWQGLGIRKALEDSTLSEFIIVTPQEDYFLEAMDSSGYDAAILNTVLPWVDEHYPTLTDRDHRAIGGISRGAIWAYKISFEHPEAFGTLGLHSLPACFYYDEVLAWMIHLSEYPQPNIRIDIGADEDPYRYEAEKASAQLSAHGYENEFITSPGGHDADYWRSQLPTYLTWYSDNFIKAGQ